jgi:hypothetical protein
MEAFQQEANYISLRLAAAGTTRDKVDRAVNSASTWTSNTEMTLLEGAAQMFGEALVPALLVVDVLQEELVTVLRVGAPRLRVFAHQPDAKMPERRLCNFLRVLATGALSLDRVR